MVVLVTIDPGPGERELVEQRLGPVRWLVDETVDGAWQGRDAAAIEGMLCLWPRSEMRAASLAFRDLPELRWMKVATAGANHVGWRDVPAEVQVISTPDATSDLIAEYVLGAVIAWARGFASFTRRIAAGEFPLGERARAVSQLRIGIVGHGGLGQAVAREFVARGAQVRAVSRSGRAASDLPVRVDTVDALPGLAAWADVLVVCVPLRRDTVGLVDADVLDRLEGLLVNVARGPVVDEAALHAWLVAAPEGHAAVLDVWWRYPKHGGHPFTMPFHHLDNVVMTPHNSPNVADFRHRMIGRACDDLRDVLASGRLRHVEDPAAYAIDDDGDGR